MKGPLFYSKILLFGEYGIIRDSICLYNFIMVRSKEMKTSSRRIASNASLKLLAIWKLAIQNNLIW
jgi:mevalonate kinase